MKKSVTYGLLIIVKGELTQNGPYTDRAHANTRGRDLYALYPGCVIYVAEVLPSRYLTCSVLEKS